jgi:transposase
VMDRGIPTKATLEGMREDRVGYLVGTRRSLLNELLADLLKLPWQNVHEGMRVKLLEKDGELYVLAQSEDRRRKENAMRRRKLKKLVHGLNRIKRAIVRRRISRDQLLRKVAVLRKEAGRIATFISVREPQEGEAVNRENFVCTFRRSEWRNAIETDGSYILRAFLPWDDWPDQTQRQAPLLWEWYMQLTRVEEAFKTLKSDLAVRPVHHQLEHRVEAHILVAFLGYCLAVTLRQKLARHAPGLTPRQVLESLRSIRMVDVHLPTTDGRKLIMPRFTEPEAQQQMILQKLGLSLPAQPPPRIRSADLSPAASSDPVL